MDKLIEGLSLEVKYSMALPFSVVFEIWKKGESRYKGGKYVTFTRFSSLNLNAMLLTPEEQIPKLGFSSQDFIFKRAKFPKGVTINKEEINQFPILIIRERYPEKWREDFIKKYEEIKYEEFLDRSFLERGLYSEDFDEEDLPF